MASTEPSTHGGAYAADGGVHADGAHDGDGAHGGDGATDRSVADMLSMLASDATLLFRQEVELAKAELRAEARTAAQGGAMLGAAGVVGHTAFLLLSFALAWGLASLVHPGLAFLIVGLVYGAAAALLYLTGRARLEEASPVPERTVETVKEDAEWARNRIG
jgi:Flp pilus assembly CpaE family ATPase